MHEKGNYDDDDDEVDDGDDDDDDVFHKPWVGFK